ncbi:MAG: protein phosphatase 2C domain-containing protein [Cyclobacteriaceae bacterium]
MKSKPMYTSIKLHPLVLFSEIGEKRNNEDYLIPNEHNQEGEKKVFICCDGVGGAPSGEIASKIACHSMADYFNHCTDAIYDELFLQNAVDFAREKMAAYESDHPESKGMKTTMTAVGFHQGGAALAWMGDSRIYQVRDGNILYQTWDHSYVNTLVEQGLLTAEETRTHPQRNIITKTLGASKSDRIPEVKMIRDLKADDFFLLCTDGLLENITDKKIKKWLRKKENPKEIKEIMLDQCIGQTHDNFSMVLIKIKSVN